MKTARLLPPCMLRAMKFAVLAAETLVKEEAGDPGPQLRSSQGRRSAGKSSTTEERDPWPSVRLELNYLASQRKKEVLT